MKAIALVSGGLDSTLAAKLIQNLGVELICLNTQSPFCLCNRHLPSGCFSSASQTAKNLGLKLVTLNVAEEILEIVKKPKHGYGSNMNPCIDCRILLFKKAKELMRQEGASFLITGEVLGQRPMSQKLNTLRLIEKEAGLEGLVLRPLSARVLSPTIAEKEGWIKRDGLLAISGRGRRKQINLAQEFGINDYPCPAGGCLLTDRRFSQRLKELMKHEGLNLENTLLLKVGRHFRLSDCAKLVVGRNEVENVQLEKLAKLGDYLFFPDGQLAGPTALGRGDFSAELIKLACQISVRYSDPNGSSTAGIIYEKIPEKERRVLEVSGCPEEKLKNLRI